MKNFFAVSCLALSFSAFAHEEVELAGRAHVINSTYHSSTTCSYAPTTFEVEAHELKDVSVFKKHKNSDVWEKVNHGYKVVDGKTIIVLPAQSHSQINNQNCAKLQVQLVK